MTAKEIPALSANTETRADLKAERSETELSPIAWKAGVGAHHVRARRPQEGRRASGPINAFAPQAMLTRRVEKALLVERPLDLGCEPVDVLNAFERHRYTRSFRCNVDRRGHRNKRTAVMRILHEMRKPHQHQPTR
jgi:hypothetical protein